MLNTILWLPKRVLLAHYVVLVHLTTPRRRLEDADLRIARLRRWLFDKNL